MTKLLEWIFAFSVIFSVWIGLLFKIQDSPILQDYRHTVIYFPVIAIGLFGILSMGIILYRVFTFNDCHEAAIELKMQIEEAKNDLTAKGFQFSS